MRPPYGATSSRVPRRDRDAQLITIRAVRAKMLPAMVEVAGAVERAPKGRARSPGAPLMLFIMFTLLVLQLLRLRRRSVLGFLTHSASPASPRRCCCSTAFGFVAARRDR